MKILHVLTTGGSLLDAIEDRRDDDYSLLAGALLPGSDTVHEMLLAARTGQAGALGLDGLLSPVQQSLLAASPTVDAAEWTSVHTVRIDTGLLDVGTEGYLYLASDTDSGLRAATFLAVGHEPRSVHYVPEPLAHGGEFVLPDQAWICRIPRLDLGRTRPDGQTWRSLGAVGRLIAHSAEQQPEGLTVVVHFSGGYKAIVPYVMVLAEAIRSRLREHNVRVRAFALHQSSVRLGDAIAVEVPVRSLSSDLWGEVQTLRAAMRANSDEVPIGTTEQLGGLMLDPIDARRARVTAPGLISTHVL